MALSETAGAIPDAEDELVALRAELEHQRNENAIKERQLDRYAADLRATSRRERQRARELSENYMATVRALAGAVEARDAYTAPNPMGSLQPSEAIGAAASWPIEMSAIVRVEPSESYLAKLLLERPKPKFGTWILEVRNGRV